MNFKRAISEQFMQDLKEGILSPILARVKEDDTLMLALRGDYINVYYRGGSLLKIESKSDSYTAIFNEDYRKKEQELDISFPYKIYKKEDSMTLVDAVLKLKYVMDQSLTISPKLEREFQQLVARENNYSSISNETEYFIIDIEATGLGENKARFDMLAVRWLSTDKKSPNKIIPVLIEMKYASESIADKPKSPGIKEHFNDAISFKENADWDSFCLELQAMMNQLNELEMFNLKLPTTFEQFEINSQATPELIFILANYNPRSKSLESTLNLNGITETDHYDLLFFRASFAGYGMHSACMLSLEDFKQEVSKLRQK